MDLDFLLARDPTIRQFLSRYGKSEWTSVLKLLLKFAIGKITTHHPPASLSRAELEELTNAALATSPFAPQPCPVQYTKADATWREDMPSQLSKPQPDSATDTATEHSNYSTRPRSTTFTIQNKEPMSVQKPLPRMKPNVRRGSARGRPKFTTRSQKDEDFVRKSRQISIPRSKFSTQGQKDQDVTRLSQEEPRIQVPRPRPSFNPQVEDSFDNQDSFSSTLDKLSHSKWVNAFMEGGQSSTQSDSQQSIREQSFSQSVTGPSIHQSCSHQSISPSQSIRQSINQSFDWIYQDEPPQRVFEVQTPVRIKQSDDGVSSILSTGSLSEKEEDFIDVG
ncbi:hypothetical protein P9112_003670 [Eukaryota sp. TZLM1-RC]